MTDQLHRPTRPKELRLSMKWFWEAVMRQQERKFQQEQARRIVEIKKRRVQ